MHSNQKNADAMNRWLYEGRLSDYRLMPNIENGIKRKHGQVNFHLPQFSTGHGCKYGHDVVEACPSCRNTSETAKHIFITFALYEYRRNFTGEEILNSNS